MSLLRNLAAGIRAPFRKRAADRDLDDELRAYIEASAAEKMKSGLARDEALRAARLEMRGSPEGVKEIVRASTWEHAFDTLWHDLRYAARQLRRSPGFALVAILTLALGIGANTSIFSVAYAVLFRPLPYPQSSQLVSIGEGFKYRDGVASGPLSIAVSRVAQDQHQIFTVTAAYQYNPFILTDQTEPSYVQGNSVSGDFFSLLGVQPLLGRPILPQDSQPDRDPVAVLGYALWQRLFGGDPAVVGRKITLDGKRYTVVGIMPPRFEFPFDGSGSARLHGLWINSQPSAEKPAPSAPPANIYVVARLKPGVTLADARAQLHALAANLVARHGYDNEHFADLLASSWESHLSWQNGPELLILLAAVGFVLLIACVNVSALLLARGWSRRGEAAIRSALGATRSRLIRQLLTESVLLSLASGTAGLLFSVWGIRMIRLVAPPGTPHIEQAGLGAVVLWFTFGISVLAGILFGLVPALHVSSRRIGASLKGGSPGTPSGSSERRPRRLRNALVVVEIALAVVLVMGGALMSRSLEKFAEMKFGWRTDHVLTMNVNFSKPICPFGKGVAAACIAAVDQALARVRAMPGIESAAAAGGVPLATGQELGGRMRINGGPPSEARINIGYFPVSPGYFRTLGIHLLQGRDLATSDTKDSPHVAVVNESFVRHYLSGNPLGQRFSPYDDQNNRPQWMQIVGVAADTLDGWLYDRKPFPAVYASFSQADFFPVTLIVRTAGDPMAIMPAIRQRVWSVDKDAPLTEIRTMRQVISDQEAAPRFHMALLGSFGVLGLLLAMLGTYGVISYAVVQRTHEVGVRMALGAAPPDVLRLILAEGILLATVGIAIGVGGSFALTRLIDGFLFEVTPTDPVAFIAVPILLFLAAALACYVPARRATRVDPIIALRHE